VPDYVPLSRRLSGDEEVLNPGVPPHLEPPLTEWITDYETHEILRQAALRAQVWYAPTNPQYDASFRIPALIKGIQIAADPPKAFLDVVDGILFLRSHAADEATWDAAREEARVIARKCAASLEKILRLGGSHWRVQGDHLEARVDDRVREAVDQAKKETAATSASTHLGNAWLACYGRNPNPGLAYSEAIKAVEAAAAPVLSPKDLKATLGTMLGQIRATIALWRFAIAPGSIDSVISAMSTLWDGQTDRHAGNRPTTPITPDAAQAAVLLAATLVHWFATGAVTRR
jgi:hypothetical protein